MFQSNVSNHNYADIKTVLDCSVTHRTCKTRQKRLPLIKQIDVPKNKNVWPWLNKGKRLFQEDLGKQPEMFAFASLCSLRIYVSWMFLVHCLMRPHIQHSCICMRGKLNMNSNNFNLLLCTLKTLKLYTLRYYILANRLHKLRLLISTNSFARVYYYYFRGRF